ncbi:hypothetical protein, partial [Streptomyces prunicolor]|uniref:hypothetical protein n=1 Tax=Streptomyces prunicolor TaxID=67348 RepID=UPI0033DDD521
GDPQVPGVPDEGRRYQEGPGRQEGVGVLGGEPRRAPPDRDAPPPVPEAKDHTGRSGIGLSFKERDGRTVWVFDKKSYDFLGSADEALPDVGVADKAAETPAA